MFSKKDINKAIHYIKNQGPWVLLGRSFLMTTGLILSIILTRMMTKDEYGEYQYILSILTIFGFLSLPASTNVLIRYYGQGYHWSYISLFFLRVKSSLLGVILFLCMAIYSYYINDIYFAIVFLVFSICFPLFYSCDLFEYLLQSVMNYKKLNLYYIVRESIRFIMIIFTYWLSGTIALTIIVYILSITIINSWSYYKIKKDYLIEYKNIENNVQKKMHTMAINLSLVGIFLLVTSQIDKILIAKYIDMESLAIYSIGMLIGMSINMFFKSILSIFNAKLVNHKVSFGNYLIIFIAGSISGWLLTYIMSYTIDLIYGNAYRLSATYANIVLLSLGVHLVSTLYHSNFLFYYNKSEKIIYAGQISISSILILLISTFIVIPVENEVKLLLLSLMYPIKSVLIIIIFSIVEKYFERKLVQQ
jgi:O-antigen/teichoic acid export membrane protein